jgi:hypothetical protein
LKASKDGAIYQMVQSIEVGMLKHEHVEEPNTCQLKKEQFQRRLQMAQSIYDYHSLLKFCVSVTRRLFVPQPKFSSLLLPRYNIAVGSAQSLNYGAIRDGIQSAAAAAAG